jgi:rubrerythrin
MQEPQQTTSSNIVYDISSVLYHSLQAAHTCAAYIKDAEQAGQQEIASFLREFQQDSNKHAEQARRLLVQVGEKPS